MAQLMDHIEYLAKEIGPRPAGTEEEQQAALYITEQLQKESGFATNLEEFSTSSNTDLARAILALVVIVATVLAIIFQVLAIPAFILAAIAAAVFALEAFDRPILSRVLSRGASQNVVAKYQPNGAEEGGRRGRSRKVILIAHYDTGQVTPPLIERINAAGLPTGLACVGGLIAGAFLLLIRIFVAPSGGMGLIVVNVLSVIAVLVCLLPVIKALLMRMAPYNEGANNNATGTAALIEVARRISHGSVSESELVDSADGVRVHGEAAAREAGLIPEGAQIVYEAEQLVPPEELGSHSEEDRLLSAKAAIAAMTGQPVERRVYGSVADKLVNSHAGEENWQPEGYQPDHEVFMPEGEGPAPEVQIGLGDAGVVPTPASVAAAAPEQKADGFDNAPSWFVAAQQNARKAAGDESVEPVQVQRSRFTEAFDYAERERAERQAEVEAAEQAERAARQREREQEVRRALEASTQARMAARSTEPAPDETAPVAPIQAEPQMEEPQLAEPQMAEPQLAEPVPAIEPAPAPEPDLVALPQVALPSTESAPAAEIDIPFINPDPQELASELPDIKAEPRETTSPSRSGILRKLRTNVPSLSGIIQPVDSAPTRRSVSKSASDDAPVGRHAAANLSIPAIEDAPAPAVAPAAAPAAAADSQLDSATVAMSPVELSNMPLPLDDLPAPEPERNPMEVSVPRSRAGNLLGRLRRDRDEDLNDSPQEWLNVDNDFDARSVGRARGGWESFRDDQAFEEDDGFGDFGTGDSDRWNGGAASRASLGRVNMRSGAEDMAEESVDPSGVVLDASQQLELQDSEDATIAEEIQQIYHFRNPQFNNEIWFVAIGSDGAGHDGAKAFMAEHYDELRGSMIIEIESLGAGELAIATEEGSVRKIQASSRAKRYVRGATAATGISPSSVSLAGTDSISSTLMKAGFQAMHLFGEENGRPALKGSADDVVENIDDMLLDEHVNFIYELLKK